MQSVLIKHCKPNEFLDSSGCLAFISVCFMFVLWFIFFIFFIYSVPTIVQFASYYRIYSSKNYFRLWILAEVEQHCFVS